MPENPALNEGTWHQAEEYIRKAFLNLDDASQDLKNQVQVKSASLKALPRSNVVLHGS